MQGNGMCIADLCLGLSKEFHSCYARPEDRWDFRQIAIVTLRIATTLGLAIVIFGFLVSPVDIRHVGCYLFFRCKGTISLIR